jgi:ABC-2 type transport system permease protein
MTTTARLARAEARKLFTTRAMPASFAAAIALVLVSVVLQAAVAGQQGTPRLGTDDGTYKLLMIGVVPCLVMLIIGILASGGEFRHRTIVPVLLATPGRGRVFAVKVLVVAVIGAVFSAITFGIGLGAVVAELSAHHLHHLPAGTGSLYAGAVIASTCFGMIGVALGALTRNTVGAIVAAIGWTILVEMIILQAVVPGIEKWLPTRAAVMLTTPPDSGHLSLVTASLVLTGYAAALLLAARFATLNRDIA